MNKKKNKASDTYAEQLRAVQIALSGLQRRIIKDGRKLLVIIEGRDAAGKDGTIKRIVEHLSPRDTRVVALGPPSDRDRRSWYFQRWTSQLPASRSQWPWVSPLRVVCLAKAPRRIFSRWLMTAVIRVDLPACDKPVMPIRVTGILEVKGK
ncbi:MAG: hypothetical protein B7Y53_08760 [Halothiobacillus sp. 28-55-5]|nr:MAG: hypothetical protein B7Y53_08760 [Halothiobacillus sp. 28-55-5]